jgi:hypothetical protein
MSSFISIRNLRNLQLNSAESFGEGSIGPFPAIDFIESAASVQPVGSSERDLSRWLYRWTRPPLGTCQVLARTPALKNHVSNEFGLLLSDSL